MGGLPSGVQIDIEFTAGSWTNVTAYIDAVQGIQFKYGRTNSAGAPQVATASLRFSNFDGRFTPFNVAGAYYPNIAARKRIRVSYASGATPRFVGYIKQWLPTMDDGQAYVAVSAVDRMDALSRRILPSIVDLVPMGTSPHVYYSLTEAAGASGVLDSVSGTFGAFIPTPRRALVVPVFGSTTATPIPDGRTTLGVTLPAITAGSYPSTGAISFPTVPSASPSYTGLTVAAWLAFTAGSYAANAMTFGVNVSSSLTMQLAWGGLSLGGTASGGQINFPIALPDDGAMHHYAFTCDGASGTGILYIDGVAAATGTGATWTAQTADLQNPYLEFFNYSTSAPLTYAVSGVGNWKAALSAAQVKAIYQAGATGMTGDTSGARIARILTYAGLAGSEYNLATGQCVMGPAVLSGKSVATALQDVATTEGGGSAVFVDVDGRIRFNDGAYRTTSAVAMTLDAQADLDGHTWQPVLDDLARVNQSTVTRNAGTVQSYTDATSVAALGVLSDSATSYASTDNAALNLAQWRVTSTAAALRVPQVAVDLMTATNSATLYTALASVTIGSRLRISSIPNTFLDASGATVRAFPVTQLDGYAEGWAEQIAADAYRITFDLSAVDSPPRGMWSDTTYGRWQPDTGSMTLQNTITNSATTLGVVTVAGHPLFTTTGGDYPFYIQIDQEIMQVTAAPGGTSPQTFPTVVRAQQGTFADAHTAGATVTLWPAATWTL